MNKVFCSSQFTDIFVSQVMKLFQNLRQMKSHSLLSKKNEKANSRLRIAALLSLTFFISLLFNLHSPQKSHYSHNAVCRWDWAQAE